MKILENGSLWIYLTLFVTGGHRLVRYPEEMKLLKPDERYTEPDRKDMELDGKVMELKGDLPDGSLSLYMGVNGKYRSQISHKKMKNLRLLCIVFFKVTTHNDTLCLVQNNVHLTLPYSFCCRGSPLSTISKRVETDETRWKIYGTRWKRYGSR